MCERVEVADHRPVPVEITEPVAVATPVHFGGMRPDDQSALSTGPTSVTKGQRRRAVSLEENSCLKKRADLIRTVLVLTERKSPSSITNVSV